MRSSRNWTSIAKTNKLVLAPTCGVCYAFFFWLKSPHHFVFLAPQNLVHVFGTVKARDIGHKAMNIVSLRSFENIHEGT